jgi:glutaredoxin
MRADIARKEEENEVIDLLSDSEAETMVEPVKRMQAKATKKKQVPTIQVNEEVIGEDGQGQS